MIATPQARASAYFPFIHFLENIGASFERFLDKELVTAIAREDHETLIPVHLAHAFLDKGAQLAGLSDFGFVVGEHARVAALGAFGRSLLRSLTLHDALGKLRSSFALYSSAERIWWYRSDGKIYICHAYVRKTGAGSRHGQQCALLLLRDLVRLAAGPNWQPKEVLSINPLLDAAPMTEVFDGAEVRHSKFCGFAFPQEFMTLSYRFQDDAARCCEFDPKNFEASAPATDFVGSIRQVIAALMKQGKCELSQVANAIGIKPRTLQRRLSQAHEEYSEVLASLRLETAFRLMNDPGRRLIDIAYELGYADPSNFTRAFRGWTGVTPSQFRQLRKEGERIRLPRDLTCSCREMTRRVRGGRV
ncbi:helix-turn-helix domain-containing protein [Bradyrhizobium sp. 190]|uniref:helix-turn-helix transcriptional regulator n=1 Tax=Bradyrhizobium sp. 190 TaxID=2782658 RepID=UPI001FFBE408|nr:helix-turn-helix transcriptional regulator [Bradyrhizobium sp. 190]MCK1513880.1 helix-turn-helix domain-containing protein [Bradyrhizobium sp. 190]